MSKQTKVQWITRTALMLALTVVFQMLRTIIPGLPPTASLFIVGTLVNLMLVLSVEFVGISSGIVIALVAPLIAALQGHARIEITWAVALGNLAIVLLYGVFAKRSAAFKWVGVVVGAIVKFAVLYALIIWVSIPLFNFPPPIVTAFTFNFSWPQFVTALGGGIVAILVSPLLKKGTGQQ